MKKSTRSFTKPEIFVDTSGFFALLVQRDSQHERAKSILAQAGQRRRRFMTTDYILDETATLLKTRGYRHLTAVFLETVFLSLACRVVWMDPDHFQVTQRFFLKHQDQDWSFTDCFSFWVMRKFGLRDALTTDDHFQEAGFQALLR